MTTIQSISKRLTKPIGDRLLFKDGEANVSKEHIDKQTLRFFKDIFTSLLDLRWSWTLLIFCSFFIVSWTFFACLWFPLAYAKGDIAWYEKWLNAADQEYFERQNPRTPCVRHLYSFVSALLFSIETQDTIGYGFRHVTEECGGGHTLLVVQRQHTTKEGELIVFHQQELKLSADGCNEQLMLMWPTFVVHRIDKKSPFYGKSAYDIQHERYEIIVILDGGVESTGLQIQIRSSYLPSEIQWGHRFQSTISLKENSREYEDDYDLFDKTYPVHTPLLSAKVLHEMKRTNDQPMIMNGGHINNGSSIQRDSGNLKLESGMYHIHHLSHEPLNGDKIYHVIIYQDIFCPHTHGSCDSMELAKLIAECKISEKLTDNEVMNMKNKVTPVPKEVKCLLTCLNEKMELINNNQINVDGCMKLAKTLFSNKTDLDKISEIKEECKSVQETDRCEYGAKVTGCMEAGKAKRSMKFNIY